MRKKINILICDDQQKFIDDFKNNHKDHYNINEENNINNLTSKIEQCKPNILLLDLYHPKDNDIDFEIRKNKAEQELQNLDKQIEITKKAVEKAWEPVGLDILQEIRKNYSSKELPVLIYSQRGFMLLSDDQLQKVEKSKGHWMQKKVYSPNTEKIRIDRIVNETSNFNHQLKKYKEIFIILTILLFVLSSFVFLKFDKTVEMVISAVLSGTFGLVSAIISTKYLDK